MDLNRTNLEKRHPAQSKETTRKLEQLVKQGEKVLRPHEICSILVLDDDGLLRNGASPGLPADYLQAIDKLKPHPRVGTCCAAAATGQIVLTPDFLADEKWNELRHLPIALGYAGAFSVPIKNASGKVLGTFGVYLATKRKPADDELSTIQELADKAAEILEH
jgi:GAF domain-containing protein